ncbi:hypothetical protein QQ045_022476 [Rhodiola kirilowii]
MTSPNAKPSHSQLSAPDPITIESIQAVDEFLMFSTFHDPIPIPFHLKRTFEAESWNVGHNDYKLLILAVHSVFLESGFVCFDEELKLLVGGFSLPVGWAANLHSISLTYTLPNLESFETVTLLFLTDEDEFIVSGSLDNAHSRIHHFSFLISKFVPAMDLVVENSIELGIGKEMELIESHPAQEVREFLMSVKRNLAWFLKIDICYAGGMIPPACLSALPHELEIKIAKMLPVRDLASLSCCCKEFKEVLADELRRKKCIDDNWKMAKGYEEFRSAKKLEFHFQAADAECQYGLIILTLDLEADENVEFVEELQGLYSGYELVDVEELDDDDGHDDDDDDDVEEFDDDDDDHNDDDVDELDDDDHDD